MDRWIDLQILRWTEYWAYKFIGWMIGRCTIYQIIYLSINQSFYLSINLFTNLSINQSPYQSIYQSIYLTIFLPNNQSINCFRVANILGFTPPELLGKPCFDLIHTEDQTHMKDSFDQVRVRVVVVVFTI